MKRTVSSDNEASDAHAHSPFSEAKHSYYGTLSGLSSLHHRFLRQTTQTQLPGSALIFQEPEEATPTEDKEVGIQKFEGRIVGELERLADVLHVQLRTFRSVAAGGAVGHQLRNLVNSNAQRAVEAVEKSEEIGDVERERLKTQVQATFLEQDMLIAAWQQEGEFRGDSTKHEGGFYFDRSALTDWSSSAQAKAALVALLLIVLIRISMSLNEAYKRCSLLIVCVVGVQAAGVLPQYCVGLLVPVLATCLRALPDRTIQDTAAVCFGAMMSNMTALVIGTFTMNAIFLQCQLEVRFIDAASRSCGSNPRLFLLMLMMGCMIASGFTFVTLLALSAMLPLALRAEGESGKSLLIGVAFGCTLGGALTPLSGNTSLIALSTVAQYGLNVNFLDWVIVSVPVLTVTCVATWVIILALFGTPPPLHVGKDEESSVVELETPHWCFIGLSICFWLSCMLEDYLAPYIGSCGNLGLLLAVLSFGSGFLKKSDFLAMPWDVLMILCGVNVLSLALNESGLAFIIAESVVPAGYGYGIIWLELGKILFATVMIAMITGHTVSATVVIPIVVALGIKLNCPLLATLLAVIVTHFAVATAHSSTDIQLTVEMGTDEETLGKRLLDRQDIFKAGILVMIVGYIVVMTVGYAMGAGIVGLPQERIVMKAPNGLAPAVSMSHTGEVAGVGYGRSHGEVVLRQIEAAASFVQRSLRN
eukprot:TRINITY_DN101025_c0_g1_i1.p1 TRINITY_DN101025_c0_g1~~TRINITY_DN101025_c0_g1_i1.p1  ORF type:complete len:725 (-),score=148.90 TRINITY_DN101025_c0_g1_i1:149-2257(-)